MKPVQRYQSENGKEFSSAVEATLEDLREKLLNSSDVRPGLCSSKIVTTESIITILNWLYYDKSGILDEYLDLLFIEKKTHQKIFFEVDYDFITE